MVAFDAFGQTVHPKDVTKAKRDAWKGGGLNVHWDIPAIFQARQRFSRNQREQLREKRRLFSPRMSGLDVVTLGSIPTHTTMIFGFVHTPMRLRLVIDC